MHHQADPQSRFREILAIVGGLVVGVTVGTSTADADSLEWSGGGSAQGQVDRSGGWARLQTPDGIQIAVRDARVKRHVGDAELQRYAAAADIAGADAELNYKLAAWCMRDGNVPGRKSLYRDFHYRRTIAAEPDHTAARAALGYSKPGSKWVRTDDLMRSRGMVGGSGRWRMPERILDDANAEEFEKASKREVRRIARLVALAQNNGSKSGEALAELQAISDPVSTEALVTPLLKKETPRKLRLLLLDRVAAMRNTAGTRALVQIGLADDDDVVREAAMNALEAYPLGRSSAVATYVPMLQSNDNALVNQAARALSYFPDPELDLTYTDALVTEHKQVVAPGAGMQVGFGGNGGGGLSTGGKPKVLVRQLQNPAVLSLLREIEPEANYGYDEDAWRLHFARKRSSFRGDLRRDP